MAALWEESVHADTDDEGEQEERDDISGGVHAAGASTATGEPDGDEWNGQDLPYLKAGVDNLHVAKYF